MIIITASSSLYPSLSDDPTLKAELDTRKKHAEDKLSQLRNANSHLEDDDNILEKIFNNLTGTHSHTLINDHPLPSFSPTFSLSLSLF